MSEGIRYYVWDTEYNMPLLEQPESGYTLKEAIARRQREIDWCDKHLETDHGTIERWFKVRDGEGNEPFEAM